MIAFLIKKSFFDGWDNLTGMLLVNLGFIVCLAITAVLPAAAGFSSAPVTVLLMLPGFFLLQLYSGAVSVLMYHVSDYQSLKFSAFKTGIKMVWKASLIFSLINGILAILLVIALPFYLSMGNFIGIAGCGILFWIGVLWLLASQYFFPFYIRMENDILKSIKKSFLFTIDNILFSITVLFLSILILTVSIPTLSVLPGISAVLLLHHDALKLRLYKYNASGEDADHIRKKVNWDVLLEEDREIVGPRTLKGMIFPWKV